MDRKLAWAAVLASFFLAIFMTQTVTSVRAETGTTFPLRPSSLSEKFDLPNGFVDANGTVFRITNSSYSNVTLTSSEFVHVLLESGPRVVSYSIESFSPATTTTLTLSGFMSNTQYHRYQDGNLTDSFTTDSVGGYSYVQDISSRHNIFIGEHISTIYIRPDGSVYPATAPIRSDGDIYTFTADIYEPVVVQRNNIIIDGNCHTLQGPGYGYGLLLFRRNNVTVRNIKITQFWLGIYFWWTNNSRIENITATKMEGLNARGIVLYFSAGNIVSSNIATDNDWLGIFLGWHSDGNMISGNVVANNKYHGIWIYGSRNNMVSLNNATNNGSTGIGLTFSFSNIVSGNNVTNNGYTWSKGGIMLLRANGTTVSDNNVTNNYCGILSWGSYSNLIYRNNFINNIYQVDNWTSVNTWDDGYPSGGNHWSDYTGVDIYSGPDQNQPGKDGIGDTQYIKWGIVDRYPFVLESGWKKYYLTIETEPSGITTIPGEGWYDNHTAVLLEAPVIVPISSVVQYRFDQWIIDGNSVASNHITVCINSSHTAVAIYVKQYYLTIVTPYDTPGGEGWYDEGETAYATLQVGLESVDGSAYGFTGWTGDTTGLDLLSDAILMNAPKTVMANWEISPVYGDIRTIGFWKHQVNVWYFTELKNAGMKIRGIGTAQVTEEELITYLTFINGNSTYFQGKIVKDNNGDGTITNLEILQNAYGILKTPTGPDSMKMRAEQQLLSLWLNLTYKAFFWSTQLNQDSIYIYYQYTFDDIDGLATIGEAIMFCEAELAKVDGNYEAVKETCDSINNNLGIVWGT